jgi:hypothetical protein
LFAPYHRADFGLHWAALGKKGDGVANRKHRSTSLMEAWLTALYPQQGNRDVWWTE